jgi:hypothetical protein
MVLAPLPFTFTLNDPANQFASFPALSAALPAAMQNLSDLFDGRGSLEVEVSPLVQANRGSGGAAVTIAVGSDGGRTILEPGTLTEARTGVDPNGRTPDIRITLDPVAYLPVVATGAQGVGNLTFILEHEALHALGMDGFRDVSGPDYGQFSGPWASVFDALTSFGAGGDPSVLYFTGPKAEALYGGPVPLTSLGPADETGENFYHVGNPGGRAGDTLLGDLMNGVEFSNEPPSPLDLAILSDLGWHARSTPTRTPQPNPAPRHGDRRHGPFQEGPHFDRHRFRPGVGRRLGGQPGPLQRARGRE